MAADIVYSCAPSEVSNICVQVRSLKEGSLLKNYKGSSTDDRVGCIAVAGSHFLLGTMQTKPFIVVWALQKEHPYLRIACTGKVDAIACSPEGTLCAAGIKEKIYIWEISTGQLLATAARHYQNVSVLCFTDDGGHLLSGAHDNTVIVWRVASLLANGFNASRLEAEFTDLSYPGHAPSTSQLTRHVWNHHTQPITGIHCGVGGTKARVLTISMDRTCKMYSLESGRILCSLLFDAPLTAVAMDTLQTWLFVGAGNGSITQINLFLPDVYRGNVTSNDHGRIAYKGHTKSITRLQVSSCGKVLVSSSLDGTVVLWDIRSKQTMKMHILKVPVTDLMVGQMPAAISKGGPVREERLAPCKPFLKQAAAGGSVSLEQTRVSLWCGDTDTRHDEEESTDDSRQLSGKELLRGVKRNLLRLRTKKKVELRPVTVNGSEPVTTEQREEDVTALREELAKMRQVHRKVLQFAEETLLTGKPPSKISKLI